jgi:hypothetical protein
MVFVFDWYFEARRGDRAEGGSLGVGFESFKEFRLCLLVSSLDFRPPI